MTDGYRFPKNGDGFIPFGRFEIPGARDEKAIMKNGIKPPRPPHCDYFNTEYTTLSVYPNTKWECVRGVGKSFGYNRFETPTITSGPMN